MIIKILKTWNSKNHNFSLERRWEISKSRAEDVPLSSHIYCSEAEVRNRKSRSHRDKHCSSSHTLFILKLTWKPEWKDPIEPKSHSTELRVHPHTPKEHCGFPQNWVPDRLFSNYNLSLYKSRYFAGNKRKLWFWNNSSHHPFSTASLPPTSFPLPGTNGFQESVCNTPKRPCKLGGAYVILRTQK